MTYDDLELHALADGQLSPEESRKVELRLAQSPEANATYQSILEFKRTVTEKCQVTVDADLWAATSIRLKELDKRKAAEGFVGKYAWGMSAAILMLIVGAGALNRQSGHTVGAGEVARMAATYAPFTRSLGSQPQDMRSWIRDVSHGAPLKLDPGQLQIRSYAMGKENGYDVTILYCADTVGPLTLVVVKGANNISGAEPMLGHSAYSTGQMDRANTLNWTDRGFAFTLIGQRSHDELGQIAEGVRLR